MGASRGWHLISNIRITYDEALDMVAEITKYVSHINIQSPQVLINITESNLQNIFAALLSPFLLSIEYQSVPAWRATLLSPCCGPRSLTWNLTQASPILLKEGARNRRRE